MHNKFQWVMILCVLSVPAFAVDRYVTPIGAGGKTGLDWANAYSNLQTAVNDCVGSASTIYMLTGRYAVASQVGILNAAGLTIQGGCTGSGTTTTTNTPTIITRSGGNIRLLAATNSLLTVWMVTFTNGYAAGDGGCLRLVNSTVLLTNCVLSANSVVGGAARYGIGIYASGGSLAIHNSVLDDHRDQDGHFDYGGGIYATGVALTLKGTRFSRNRVGANNNYSGGGALHLVNGSALISGCTFATNYMRSTGFTPVYYGGCIYASAVSPLTLTNCTFVGNYADGVSGAYGGVLYRTGAGSTLITDCRIADNSYERSGEDLYFNTTGETHIRNTEITGGSRHGIYKAGAGSISLTNCLVGGQPGHGLHMTAGAVTIRNSTMAGNGGWGLTNSSSTVTITDSIVWNNAGGGITPNSLTITYTCNQEGHAGSGNLSLDPRFIAGYYLSLNGLTGQSVDSPCRDVGSQTAAAAGLSGRTTRTDGIGDGGTVDLGYHYAGSAAGLENLVLHVDVHNGGDGNTGQGWGAALQSIGAALSKAIDGTTIHIATGTYNTIHETFPLTIRDPRVTLRGTNRAATVINADASGRVFSMSGKSGVRLEGLTITNGYVAGNGPGLLLINSVVTLTNCAVSDCRAAGGAAQYGMGIYAAGGNLSLYNSRVSRNRDSDGHFAYGGGVYASGVNLALKDTVFEHNRVGANNSFNGGGALYLLNGSALISGCTFGTNYMRSTGYTPAYYGGCIYASGLSSMILTNSTFTGNYADGIGGSYGGVLYRAGAGTTLITGCRLENNSQVRSGEDLYFTTTGPTHIRNTEITGGSRHGIYKAGTGSLSLTNVLIAGQPQHGIVAAAGALTLANVTLADNVGRGLTNSAATINLLDSIAWGNGYGGITPNGLTITYTCNQDGHAGTGNVSVDPVFAVGYYLSVEGQPGQATNSPCRDIGSRSAVDAGVSARTTRTDGAVDGGTVDLGYHYAGVAEGLANLTLHVNVNRGNDGNNGWSWGNALRTIGAALARAIDGSVIHVATGTYNTVHETFPLTIQDSRVTLRGTNRAATVINANASERILLISGRTGIRLEGLSFTNGYVAGNGAGIYSVNSSVLVTNCVVSGNRTMGSNRYGIGMYTSGGTLTMVNSELNGNRYTDNTDYFGGGLYASGANVRMNVVTLRHNNLSGNWNCRGAGIFLNGGQADIANCVFEANGIEQASPGQTHSGGAIHAEAVNPLVVSNCSFFGNYVKGAVRQGGVMYLGGAGLSARIVNCVITGNVAVSSSDDVYVDTTGSVAFDRTVLAQGSAQGFYKAGTGSLSLTNCLLHSQPGHGVRAVAGILAIRNCTITGNTGWGVTNSAGMVTVKNSIAWGNTVGGFGANMTVTYSDSQNAVGGTGNKNLDPAFMSVAANNYRLSAGSPCINNGDNENWMDTAFDMDGNRRRIGSMVDMGCYESPFGAAGGSIFMFQ